MALAGAYWPRPRKRPLWWKRAAFQEVHFTEVDGLLPASRSLRRCGRGLGRVLWSAFHLGLCRGWHLFVLVLHRAGCRSGWVTCVSSFIGADSSFWKFVFQVSQALDMHANALMLLAAPTATRILNGDLHGQHLGPQSGLGFRDDCRVEICYLGFVDGLYDQAQAKRNEPRGISPAQHCKTCGEVSLPALPSARLAHCSSTASLAE